jgi:hypothetical protein
MAGLVPAITTNNMFLSEIDATNPGDMELGSTALNRAQKKPRRTRAQGSFSVFSGGYHQ